MGSERRPIQPLKENDLVYVIPWTNINFMVYRDTEIHAGKEIWDKFFEYYLLLTYSNSDIDIFKKFLSKYGRHVISRTSAVGADEYWKIEFGILTAAYRCFEGDPRELERIMKVAKTKEELKIHLEVS